MALFLFTKAILAGEPIKLFNEGNHTRDFTYIDDIAEGVIKVLDKPASPDTGWSGKNPSPATSKAPWRVYNIGSNNPSRIATDTAPPTQSYHELFQSVGGSTPWRVPSNAATSRAGGKGGGSRRTSVPPWSIPVERCTRRRSLRRSPASFPTTP